MIVFKQKHEKATLVFFIFSGTMKSTSLIEVNL